MNITPLETPTATDIREEFETQGYYHAKGVYSPEAMQELETEFDRIVAQLTQSGQDIDAKWSGPEMERISKASFQILHTHNVHRFSSLWLQAMLHTPFLDVVEAILGPNIGLNHNKLFQKPAETGAPFPMHQDWSYFPTELDRCIAGILHVSEATDEMGCLRVVPGSHKLGRMQDSNGQKSPDWLKEYPVEEALPIPAEPGDVVFFHYFTLHGSMPNQSDKVRKTVLSQLYAGEDKLEETANHPDEQLVLRGWSSRATRDRAGTSK